MEELENPTTIVNSQKLLERWQGHRRLTTKVIKAIPVDKLFTYSIGGMRTFGEIANELLNMAAPSAIEIVPGTWGRFGDIDNSPIILSGSISKAEIFELWDWTTEQISKTWKEITPERLRINKTAYGQFEGTIWSYLFYIIDNVVHHRGQGYLYLLSLGIEPPYFYER